MQPELRAAAFIWDALHFGRNVHVAVGNTNLETYLEGGPVTWATERQMELVGEALKNLRKVDPESASRVPNVHKIIGMRNVLVHGYGVARPAKCGPRVEWPTSCLSPRSTMP